MSLKILVNYLCIKKHGYIYSCIYKFPPIANIYNGTLSINSYYSSEDRLV